MAAKVPPPKELNLDSNENISEAWKRWKKEFQFFLVATETDKKDDKVKTSTLLTCIGQRSREVYYNFTFDDPADAMKYKTMIEKFDSHFCTKSNITFLRFKFFNVKQQENQPVDDFVNELRTKAQECEFLELTESLIRDRIVCGINNLKLQERLLREPDLTLDRAILLCKADEDTIKQTTEIQKHTGTAESKVDAIKTKYKGKKQFTKSKPAYQKQSVQQSSSKTVRGCRYCGKTHGKGQCPAYGKICSSCNKRNHFASVCLSSKQIKSVCVENSSDSTDYEDNQFFIGSVEVDTKQLSELNSSENNIRPEKDQLTELDSSENNFVEDNDSLKYFNDQTGVKQNSPDDDQIDIENSYFVNGVDSEIYHSNDWILPLQTSGTEISFKLDTGGPV